MLSNIPSSAAAFSFCLQTFPVSRSFPMSQLFTSSGQSIGASAPVLPMNSQGWFLSFLFFFFWLISFRIAWFDLLAAQGTLESSPVPQSESINSSPLSLLYDPTLTFIHEYWKNLVHRWLFFPTSSCGGRVKGALCGLFYECTNPIHETWPSWPNHHPKAPSPTIILSSH